MTQTRPCLKRILHIACKTARWVLILSPLILLGLWQLLLLAMRPDVVELYFQEVILPQSVEVEFELPLPRNEHRDWEIHAFFNQPGTDKWDLQFQSTVRNLGEQSIEVYPANTNVEACELKPGDVCHYLGDYAKWICLSTRYRFPPVVNHLPKLRYTLEITSTNRIAGIPLKGNLEIRALSSMPCP